MKKKLSLMHCSYFAKCCIILIVSILGKELSAQEVVSIPPDSTIFLHSNDSLLFAKNTTDSTFFTTDSLPEEQNSHIKTSKNAVESIVTYLAKDSIRMDIRSRKAYLYGTAIVYYDDMELHADYIEIDFKNNELYASGVADSVGQIHGNPVFMQGGGTYRSQELKYNFSTQKGKISNVITMEGDGFIHGQQIKKFEEHSFIKGGRYTTCELDHPHFEISFGKAKVIPKDKIITGPAYLSFVGIPTFIAIPFGFFPNEKGRNSGFIMPTFGEVSSMGFYFQNIGFYFGINDHVDLAVTGDIYTRGSWAARIRSNYNVRYKVNGFLELSYAQNLIGERYTSSYKRSNDFKVKWSHKQDPKSHPTTRFSADVNIMSGSYNKYNSNNLSDVLTNQYNSTVNFSTSANGIFNFNATLSYNQNTNTKIVNLTLPSFTMSVNQFYPFRKKNKIGTLKWYDNISLLWNSETSNQISSIDSMMLDPQTWKNTNIGMKHYIPLTIPIKIAKLINWDTKATLTEKFYLQATDKEFVVTEYDANGNIKSGRVEDVFRREFNALHDLALSSSLSTKVYFMYQFKKGALNAIRHVMTPNINFTYRPQLNPEAYSSYFNPKDSSYYNYSRFTGSSYVYGGVTASDQAVVRFSLSNNIEMKVRSRKDTITGTRKIVLFEELRLSAGYDFAADSLRWQNFEIYARTTLFKQLFITINLSFDPYCINSNGKRINQTELKVNNRLFRLASSNLDIAFNWTIDRNLFKRKDGKAKPEKTNKSNMGESVLGIPTRPVDYNNPWSINLNYNFVYNVTDNYNYYNLNLANIEPNKYNTRIIHSIGINGDVSITRKWKLGFSAGYDIQNKELTYTKLDIYRDLHCWEMRFEWVPFGSRKGFSFTINVKASILQDLKYNMKRDFRDNL